MGKESPRGHCFISNTEIVTSMLYVKIKEWSKDGKAENTVPLFTQIIIIIPVIVVVVVVIIIRV